MKKKSTFGLILLMFVVLQGCSSPEVPIETTIEGKYDAEDLFKNNDSQIDETIDINQQSVIIKAHVNIPEVELTKGKVLLTYPTVDEYADLFDENGFIEKSDEIDVWYIPSQTDNMAYSRLFTIDRESGCVSYHCADENGIYQEIVESKPYQNLTEAEKVTADEMRIEDETMLDQMGINGMLIKQYAGCSDRVISLESDYKVLYEGLPLIGNEHGFIECHIFRTCEGISSVTVPAEVSVDSCAPVKVVSLNEAYDIFKGGLTSGEISLGAPITAVGIGYYLDRDSLAYWPVWYFEDEMGFVASCIDATDGHILY